MGSKLRKVRLFAPSAIVIVSAALLAPQWSSARSIYDESQGYLGLDIRKLAARVPPPSQAQGIVESDKQAFETTRALEGSLRWKAAAHDADKSPKSLLKAFSCASGVELSRKQTPHIASLLTVAGADASFVASHAKSNFARTRPYVLYGGATCVPAGKLGANRDYPSGHSARGWTWGLVLAELLPDREEQLTARAEAYGESRVVCGFHSPTGIEAGHGVAVLTVDALLQDSAFRADMRQASEELATLRREGQLLPARQCQTERALMDRPY
jgi:acid phosphatase (class A)